MNQGSEQVEWQLELEVFNGPFDLLLHLIKKMEVDINDIPMTEITEQYMAYVKSMQELQLDVVGDYLVMAASLLEIKSRLLLPIEPREEMEDSYEGEDPRSSLVQQLLLYQQFQEVATQLELKEAERAKVFNRPASDISKYQQHIPLREGELTLELLASRMEKVLQRVAQRQPKLKAVTYDPMTVDEKINQMKTTFAQLSSNESLSLDDFIEEARPREIITSFMAMLELVRKQYIYFKQDVLAGPIEMRRRSG